MAINKYEQAKIYTIRYYDEPEYLYIGATVQTLDARFKNHMSTARTQFGANSKLYQAIRGSENKDWWYIELYKITPVKIKNNWIIENNKL